MATKVARTDGLDCITLEGLQELQAFSVISCTLFFIYGPRS